MNVGPFWWLARPILLATLMIIVGGCFVVVGTERSEPRLDRSLIGKIQPGKTTAGDIVQWFGPPAAIARQSTAQQANAGETAQLLEVFAAQRVLREQHVVYFYHSASTRGAVGGVLLAAGVYSQTIVDRLWVLIDKQSGLVDDYVFRPKE